MNVHDEIEEFKKKLADTVDAQERGEILLTILEKYAAVVSIQSEPHIEGLKIVAAQTSDLRLTAWAHYHEGVLKRTRSENAAALDSFMKGLEHFLATEEAKGIILSYVGMGIAHKNTGNYAESLRHQFEALRHSEKISHPKSMALAYNNIGNVYNFQSNYPEALKYHLLALQIRREANDVQGMSASFRNIGNVYYYQHNYSEALTNYSEALRMSQLTGDKSGIAASYSNMGVAYDLLKDFEKAIAYYNAAIQLYTELKNVADILVTYNSLGASHHSMGNFEEAMQCQLMALKMSEEISDVHGMAVSNGGMGLVLKSLNRFDEPLVYLNKSVEQSVSLHANDMLSQSYLTMSEVYESKGDYQQAFEYHKLFHNTEKDILGETAQEQLTQLNFKHNTEQKEAVHKATEKILHNILPQKIAERIKNGEEEIIERFENCSVLFADMVGFTKWSEKKNVNELGATLNHIFSMFDGLANVFGVEKIKTIGDAYMCVSGLPEPCDDHAERMAKMALAMNEKIKEAYPNGEIKLRIGIHTGEVVAGVIGKNKYAYDLWGDTVNTASRMESHGVENKIQVSEPFKNLLGNEFQFEERGEIEIKGKGKMKTWFLLALYSPIFRT